MSQETYECSNGCLGTFQTNQLQFEEIPDNMEISTPGIDVEKGIPKCPHCGHLAFFGFKIIDIAF